MNAVIHTLILLWCVHHANGSTWNTYNLKWNYDNGHSCIDITVVCTHVRQTRMVQSGIITTVIHTCIDITVVCTSNALVQSNIRMVQSGIMITVTSYTFGSNWFRVEL